MNKHISNTTTQNKNPNTSLELRDILISALVGEKNAEESIERLSAHLFPEEDLIDTVKSMKIQKEITLHIQNSKQKGQFEMSEITRKNNLYSFDLRFSDAKNFLSVNNPIAELAAAISKKYEVDVRPNIQISQTYSMYKKNETPNHTQQASTQNNQRPANNQNTPRNKN